MRRERDARRLKNSLDTENPQSVVASAFATERADKALLKLNMTVSTIGYFRHLRSVRRGISNVPPPFATDRGAGLPL